MPQKHGDVVLTDVVDDDVDVVDVDVDVDVDDDVVVDDGIVGTVAWW